jgi:hypothetical protein
MKARLRAKRLPELRRAPRALHQLLVHMLRENPDNRAKDPVAFEAEIRDCLTKVERRQALGRKLGLPLGGVVPRSRPTRSTSSVGRQIALGFVAVAALLLTAAVVAAFLLPVDAVPFLRPNTETKLVGVPDKSGPRTVGPPNAIPSPAPNAPVAVNNPIAAAAESQSPQETNSAALDGTASPAQVASSEQTSATANEAGPPAEGPETNEPAAPPEQSPAPAVAENPSKSSASDNDEATTASKKPGVVSSAARKSTAMKRSRVIQARPNDPDGAVPARVGRGRISARVVGITPDGRLLLRLPSGRIVTAYPGQGSQLPPPRRTIIQRRTLPDDQGPPEQPVPHQPFNPDYPLGD